MKLLSFFALLTIVSVSILGVSGRIEKVHSVPLSGEWELCLDSMKQDIPQLDFNLKVRLPGTLDEAGIGKQLSMLPEMKREVMLHLQRKHEYIGRAWYRKMISVPASATGKKAILKLERVLWRSTVFIDGKPVGSDHSLSVPHLYDLTEFLSPGMHELLICIDNTRQFELNKDNMAHAYTNETQIMWNGILGEFQVDFYPVPPLKNVQIFPDLQNRTVHARVQGEFGVKDEIRLSVRTFPGNKLVAQKQSGIEQEGKYQIELERNIESWSEFSPVLYQLETSLIRNGKKVSSRTDKFGFRSLEAKGKKLMLNGEPLFLRGTLECSIFPLTGHPPVEADEWQRIFKTVRSYGLNHIRFHSWCPPEAAFSAADRTGFYLQVELPNWNTSFGKDSASVSFIESEARRIIAEYGNHPSFCLMSMGNELQGDFGKLHDLVNELKNLDNRHLYTTTSFTFEKGHGKSPEPVDDYLITQYTDSGWVRGQGVFDSNDPNFNTDYSRAVKHLTVPLITHEIGQYSVYPDLNEIEKYTGILDPLNFKAIHNDLQKKGLLHLADDYLMASGKLAALLYKEEIERALKTDGISGFQLLDLHDFPGQGTALVGLLNAFWESKGIIEPDEFRQFCSEVVPLIWMDKAVYKNTDSLKVEIGLANYSATMHNKTLKLELVYAKDHVLHQEKIRIREIPVGQTSGWGRFVISLGHIREALQLTLRLSVEGTGYSNSWPVWVYPDSEVIAESKTVVITRSFDEAGNALRAGKKVLLNPRPADLSGLEGKFVPVFWSPVHFPDQPGTMGLLIDPAHPAFELFPTEFHSNWQWWNLCKQSKTLDINGFPVTSLVRVIDNFYKNRNLTNLFEAKVGDGKLLFSSMDLLNSPAPEVRQLLRSIIHYMESGNFNPQTTIDFEELKGRFE
ncbi:MAG: sugar-binding domain-containing protein [Mangrovibacterium sp.]